MHAKKEREEGKNNFRSTLSKLVLTSNANVLALAKLFFII
jgi:hypothetical protein